MSSSSSSSSSVLFPSPSSVFAPTRGKLGTIVDSIIHEGLPLSDPKRIKQREVYWVLISRLYETYFWERATAKTPKQKREAKGACTEISWSITKWITGEKMWRHIRKNLLNAGVIKNNDIEDRTLKKTYGHYCAHSDNYQGRPFGKSYRIAEEYLDPKFYTTEQLTEFKGARSKIGIPERELSGVIIGIGDNVTLDVDGALQKFEEIKKDKDNFGEFKSQFWETVIRNFNDTSGETICSTGRVFNKVNRLPAPIRDFVYINGSKTKELDIKSCNPAILYVLAEGVERENWGKIITARKVYELFAKHAGFNDDVDACKDAFVKYLGGSRRKNPMLINSFFRKHFPIMHRKMVEIMRSEPKRGELSRHLQKIESNIVVVEMAKAPFQTVSIHDGLRVEEQHASEAKEMLHKAFRKHVGCDCVITGLDG